MIDRRARDDLPYPDDAFQFVEQGLPYAVHREHGEPSPDLRQLEVWLQQQDVDFDKLIELYESGGLPGPVQELIQELGGPERLNRHISGQELCWGLRDLAVERWGLLAKTVLRQWKVKRTEDFGRIVFALIDEGRLRKQADDSIDDFRNVYDFDEAFNLADLPEASASDD
jgi:uncharacterized repeat protein (TIGR04138 family)